MNHRPVPLKQIIHYMLIKKFLFIFQRQREREHKQGERQAEQAEGEAGFPQSGEPNAGLNPRTPGL